MEDLTCLSDVLLLLAGRVLLYKGGCDERASILGSLGSCWRNRDAAAGD